MFSGSPSAALFGPVIAIMLSLNIVARIILMVAAWMGTAGDDSMFHTVATAPAPADDPRIGPAEDRPTETIGAHHGVRTHRSHPHRLQPLSVSDGFGVRPSLYTVVAEHGRR